MLLTFSGLLYIDESEEDDQIESIVVTPIDDRHTAGSSDSSTEDESEAEKIRQKDQPVQKCAIPQRGDQYQKNNCSKNNSNRDRGQTDRQAPPRRGNRRRQLPACMQSDDWQIHLQPLIITVEPSDTVKIWGGYEVEK